MVNHIESVLMEKRLNKLKKQKSVLIEQIVNLIIKNQESPIVSMLLKAMHNGNPILPKKKFLERYGLSDTEFASGIARINPANLNITLEASHSIIKKTKGYYVSPLHVKTLAELYKRRKELDARDREAAKSLMSLSSSQTQSAC